MAQSQFVVTLNQTSGFNCIDSTIQFVAVTTDNGVVIEDVDYTWELDGGNIIKTVPTNDTLQVKFDDGGGHIVRVDASKEANIDYALLRVEIALVPNFSGTKSDREEPICKGQRINLTGKINDSTWYYNVPDTILEETASEFLYTKEYIGIFDYRIFAEDQSIAFAEDIDSVGIKMEHSNLSQVKIELICPDGNSILLKDFGGADMYMGEPVDDEDNSEQEGVGYEYYFTNNPDNGVMNSVATGSTLPSGSYTSEEPFSNLTGCSLNGEWKIKITDNTENDNGYVFFARLSFEESQLPARWEFSHTYQNFKYKWSGDGYVSSTNQQDLIALAIPESYGGQRYHFTVIDDFNCPQDTFIDVDVEPVDLSVSPEEAPFNEPFNFLTTVSWATEYNWTPDTLKEEDNYTTLDEKYENHYYEKEGIYGAMLIATTDDGCRDTAFVNVLVTIPLSQEVALNKAFSPDAQPPFNKISIDDVSFIESIECWIYSRWGKRVAKWENVDDAKEGWDGRINGGMEASPGVYYYVIKYRTYAGEEKDVNGFFHLFRK